VSIDVTDATFEAEVVNRSATTPVVVDLWAPWCGPCRTLGPILDEVVDGTDGDVVLVKVNVDENPQVSQAFQVRSIPAVYALKDGQVVDAFIGAQGKEAVAEFVDRLLPTEKQSEVNQLVATGTEESLRAALELDPPNERAILGLAEILVGKGETDDALQLLDRVPQSPESNRIAALARGGNETLAGDVDATVAGLLDRVKTDADARQEFLDLLELLGPDDPRTSDYRRQLTARLY
jgi:putative thioredoxin